MREDIRKELLSLYRLYRFDAIDESSNYIVFQYNKGYFNNIEILVIEKDYECSVPLKMDNFIYIANELYIHDKSIVTPEIIKKSLAIDKAEQSCDLVTT